MSQLEWVTLLCSWILIIFLLYLWASLSGSPCYAHEILVITLYLWASLSGSPCCVHELSLICTCEPAWVGHPAAFMNSLLCPVPSYEPAWVGHPAAFMNSHYFLLYQWVSLSGSPCCIHELSLLCYCAYEKAWMGYPATLMNNYSVLNLWASMSGSPCCIHELSLLCTVPMSQHELVTLLFSWILIILYTVRMSQPKYVTMRSWIFINMSQLVWDTMLCS